jgi:fatty-acyl-CoA synthase
MKGYWGDTKQTTENIVDGWMKTGDIGVIDDRGYCKIVGRYKVKSRPVFSLR